MEKITREELMKKLNLTNEELEKAAGGNIESCMTICDNSKTSRINACPMDSNRAKCVADAWDWYQECVATNCK